ncbi:AraC family transcriptional regulator [uncultured Roseibium sp.]|uniref:AraC family transcriptional regulator n=1 Tax=uncultured Roseibium sp. TaxID=1936171 RepID=UPI00321715BA
MSLTTLDRERYVLGDASAHVGFLNCERIAERSHIHDWTVEPHYHEGLAQLFVFDAGTVDGLIDTRRQTLTGPALVWLPALCTHAFNYPKDMQGWVLTVPTADVARLTERGPWLSPWIGSPQILAGDKHRALLEEALELSKRIETEHENRDEVRNAVLEAQFFLLLVHLHRGLTQQAGGKEPVSDRRTALIRQLQTCLDRHMPETRSVTEYAKMLSVTPTHLSRVTKAVTGKTAAEIIQDRVLLEAKRRLAFTDLPVSEIAYALRFSSPSYFTRFFAARMAETPKAFRQRSRGASV